jgi:hypothetical protein
MKRRTVKILKWFGIVILGLGLVWGALDIASRRALKREYAALQAEGRPMQRQEIVPPAIPVADNAALVYNAAVQMLKAEPPLVLDAYTPPAGRHINNLFEQLSVVASDSPVSTEHATRLLDHPQVVEFLGAVEHGAARPGYRQELDYSQGAALLMPHLGEKRHISRILSVRTRRQAAAGDTDAAWRTALTGLRFADSLRDEPVLISQLVRVAQAVIALEAIRAVAEVAPPAAEDDAELETLLASLENQEPLVRAIDGERLILGEWAFMLPASSVELMGPGKESQFLSIIRWTFRPLLGWDHAAYMRVMRSYARHAAEPYAPGDDEFGDRLLADVPRYCILTRMTVPAISAAKARYISMIAEARITRAGLAAMRYNQEHGALPPDLEALKLTNPDDPFTGKPLIYRTTDRGFTIYSVGVNLVDDGGTKGKDSKSGDLVWRYNESNPAEQPAGGDGKPAPQP